MFKLKCSQAARSSATIYLAQTKPSRVQGTGAQVQATAVGVPSIAAGLQATGHVQGKSSCVQLTAN
ncbi:hypothetical protein AB1K83_12740 [Sporosarcina sp. 179-K 3D1 HS]|uniref:hypothetical protein n=1 Tax=Sporosarcina sp. 179-K 3D1 HS TaxID=3232169 RepID=UPI00399FF27F